MGRFFLLTLSLFSLAVAAPIFDNTLTLSELGERDNKIPTVLPAARLTAASPLRTNDYPTLQLSQDNRAMTRIGAYEISQGATGAPFGNGPGVTFPARIFVDNSSNPAQNLSSSNAEAMMVFGSSETTTYTVSSTIGSGAGQSETFQSMDLTFTDPGDAGKWIQDLVVIGNAFHDIRYNDLTPYIGVDGNTSLVEVTTFPSDTTYTPAGGNIQTLDAADKLRFKFKNVVTGKEQTWLLYLEAPAAGPAPTLVFEAYFNNASAQVLQAQASFTGFLRVGIVQENAVPLVQSSTQKKLGKVQEVPLWSTGLGIQTIAATPGSMFVLWPSSFVPTAVNKIKTNFSKKLFLPFCPWVANYLPLIALESGADAENFFYALQDKGSSSYGLGMNPFLAYFGTMLGKYYSDDIKTYQSQNRAFPNYTVNATAATIESVYDASRSDIPESAEITFTADTYTWTYAMVKGSAPLISFPRYKVLDSGTPDAGYIVKDPFKGDLLAMTASGDAITFKEGTLPTFLTTNFLPQDLWTRMSSDEQIQLNKLFNGVLATFSPGVVLNDSNLVYTIGQVGNKWALTVRYGMYMLEQLGKSDSEIKKTTRPIVTALQTLMEDWLINRQLTIRNANAGALPDSATSVNFFIGDATNPAVNADLSGMENINPGTNFGNAFYNDHHLQYGYWMGIAALLVEWDNKFNTTSPWIASMKTSATGAGPYKMKRFVDVIWRDTRNPDPEDPDLPFNRHGNPWEGHSNAVGIVPTLAQTNGRNQESLAEDFNCWLTTMMYARAILASSGLTAADTMGFDTLEDFCSLGLRMAATGGTVYYNTPNWPFVNRSFNFNAVVANTWDSLADTNTFFAPGTPPCVITKEDIVFSNSRLNAFFDGYGADEQEAIETIE